MSKQKKQSKEKIRKPKRPGGGRKQTLVDQVSDKFEIENLARGYVFHLKLPPQKKVAELLKQYQVEFGVTHALEMSEWYRTLADEMIKKLTGTPIRVRYDAS